MPPGTPLGEPTAVQAPVRAAADGPAHAHTFLPGLAHNYLTQQSLPTRKELTVLFVDIADSTATILNQPPEAALALVQSFMEVVTEITLAH